jgi:hypothetical protein
LFCSSSTSSLSCKLLSLMGFGYFFSASFFFFSSSLHLLMFVWFLQILLM